MRGRIRRFTLLVIALSAAIATTACAGTPTPTSTPEQLAWTACTMFVERQYKEPASAAEPFRAAQVTPYGASVRATYGVNVNYPSAATTFHCMLVQDPQTQKWLLYDLKHTP